MNLWVATANRNKVFEISEILGPSVQLKSLLDIPKFPEIEENAETFRGNALIKVRALWAHVHEPVFADDSGLEVDALDGRPGVHSMRYSEPNPTYEKNVEKLLREMRGVPQERRTARFRCSVAYIDARGREHFFDGTVEGFIGFERRGQGGFGFDPVFMIPGKRLSMAELSAEEKNRLSHRGQALQGMKVLLGL